MPNISRGTRMSGLMAYLVGPGRRNEHTDPHLVAGDPAIMAWHDDTELSHDAALSIARELDHPRRAFMVDVPGGHVWHCSLSLRAEEGQQTDGRWAEIAQEFVDRMGFSGGGEEPEGGRAACRWVAVRHGLSSAGNDHVHLVVNLVREDGTKADVWRDQPRAQKVCGELEQRYGLQVLESRSRGRGERGVKPAELEEQRRTGAPETVRETLARTVRAAAAASGDEAEFVRRLRAERLLVRPRYAAGTDQVVAGYSVAARPASREDRPVWYGGGQLAKDLTLPRLREDWPDTPESAQAAVAEWQAARRQRRPAAPGRETVVPEPDAWEQVSAELQEVREYLRRVPVEDVAEWARVARETSGAFAAWSRRVEDTPGPLAATADALARSAQVPAWQTRGQRRVGPTARGAALLLASAAHGGRGPVAEAVLLRQLANMARALHDAHVAVGDAQRAQEIATAVRQDLERVRQSLPALELSPAGPVPDLERGPRAATGVAPPARRVGSVLPADLERSRRVQEATAERGGPER